MLTPLEQALPQILADCRPLLLEGKGGAGSLPASHIDSDIETVALTAALGRALAQDIVAGVDVPPDDNSAMDGYALRACDWRGGVALPVSQRIAAGMAGQPLQPGTAARIFTGAPIPSRADTVIMQENAVESNGVVLLQGPVRSGDNVRPRGQDIVRGATVMSRGHRLQPQDLGVIASVGVGSVNVLRRLRVAVLSTGNELREPGDTLAPGQLYNSNRYTLCGMLQMLGVDAIDGGIAPDSLDRTVALLDDLAGRADLVVTTGGVSAGEEDYVRAAIEKSGRIVIYKLAIKPGKPLTYGRLGNSHASTPIFGLPGNPAAVFVTFLLVVRPYLLAMQGVVDTALPAVPARAAFDWPEMGKRAEYLRARVAVNEGELWVDIARNQSSGVLSSASWANALAVVPIGSTLKRGDNVNVLLLQGLLR
jgi:molybdopterin molybdotransferase